MKATGVIFILALITIADEIYADPVLTGGQADAGVPDAAAMAVAHGATDSFHSESRP